MRFHRSEQRTPEQIALALVKAILTGDNDVIDGVTVEMETLEPTGDDQALMVVHLAQTAAVLTQALVTLTGRSADDVLAAAEEVIGAALSE